MRFSWYARVVAGSALAALLVCATADAQEAKAKPVPAQSGPPKTRMVPVLVLKPGETKELLFSTSCTLLTRGRGLLVGEMRDGRFQNEGKSWKRDGVSVIFPQLPQQSKGAPLATKGNNFLLRVTAAQDARAGLIELHIADETCSGTCDTDLCVLVVAATAPLPSAAKK